MKRSPKETCRLLESGIQSGPFQTEHHRTLVASFHQAFINALMERLLPRLTIRWTRMQGSVTTAYDAPRYLGPLSVCKYQYGFEGSFLRGSARETASVNFEVEPGKDGFSFRFDRIRVLALWEQARMRRWERRTLLSAKRRAIERIDPRASVEESWSRCAAVWTASEFVEARLRGPLPGVGAPPPTHMLCEEFGTAHPGSEKFLRGRPRDPDARLAANAFKCLVRMGGLDRRRFPKDLLASRRTFQHLVGCTPEPTTLGRYFRDYFDALEAGASPLEIY